MSLPSFFDSFFRKWLRGKTKQKPIVNRPPKRHLLVEQLEDRLAPAVLPAPLISDPAIIYNGAAPPFGTGPMNNVLANSSSPQIAIDPTNPLKMVEVHSAGPGLVGQYTINGGQSWVSFRTPALNTLNLDTNNRLDPTIVAPTGGAETRHFAQVTTPSVTFDKTGMVYVVARQHNVAESSGVIVLDKYDFDGGSPTQLFTNKVMTAWVGQDAAFNPIVAIDNNLTTYTDPETGEVQTDTLATLVDLGGGVMVPKAIYVAWNSNVTNASGNIFPGDLQPFGGTRGRIFVVASNDGGQEFTSQQLVSDQTIVNPNSGLTVVNPNAAAPQIVFSQGKAGDPTSGGQLVIVYAAGDGTNIFRVDTTRPDQGNAATPAVGTQTFTHNGGGLIDGIVPPAGVTAPDSPGLSAFTLNVDITDPDFDFVRDLDVLVSIQHPHINHLDIRLVAPNGQTVRLVRPAVNGDGNAINPAQGLPDAVNLGRSNVNGSTAPNAFLNEDVGTVFDQDAARNIRDASATAPFFGHFRPEIDSLNVFNGLSKTSPGIMGNWRLEIRDVRNDRSTPGPVQFLSKWTLTFSSRMSTSSFATDRWILGPATVTGANTNTYPTTAAVYGPKGVGPGIVLAIDNTLGSFSPFQNRIYAAYTGGGGTNTDVFLTHSDNYGTSWSSPLRVNDDSAFDNFSEGNRPQFTPTIAVDPITGTLVYSYYDGRTDASLVRAANALVTSIDGGDTFSKHSYLNQLKTATDALTQKVITIEPVPGNQNVAGIQGFGTRQGIVVHGGKVYNVFASNRNIGANQASTVPGSAILTADVLIAAGPRVVFGDMGTLPGTSFNSFTVIFDRPVDPLTFGPEDVTIIYRDPNTPASDPGTVIPATFIDALDDGFLFGPNQVGGVGELATQFRVFFAAQNKVGTYSYAIGPNINDKLRQLTAPAALLQNAYELNGDYTDSFDSGADLQTPNGGTIGPTGHTFSSNGPGVDAGGLSLSNTINPDTYSIEVRFRIDSVVGENGGPWVHLIDFKNETSDQGLYSFQSRLQFYNVATGGAIVFSPNTMHHLVITRDGTSKQFVGYVDGVQQISFADSTDLAVFDQPGNIVRFLMDDNIFPDEESGGFIDQIRIYSGVLNAGQVLDLFLGGPPPTTAVIPPGNFMDQNNNSVTSENQRDRFAVPDPVNDVPFQLPYEVNSLPLILTGAHVESTSVPGHPTTADNRVINATNNAVDVRFDRDIQTATFTPADIIHMIGPAGIINGPFTVIPNPGGTPGTLARTFRIGFPTQNLGGTYRIVVGSNIQAADDTRIDTNLNAGLFALRGVDPASATLVQGVYSNNVPTPITGNKTSTSTITVPDSFVVTQDSLTRIQLELGITFPDVRDLEGTLTAPDGTVVRLFTNVGTFGSPPHNNFTGTLFDDIITGTPIQQGGAPFSSGPYNPQLPLSQLIGKSAKGIWSLSIKNDAGLTGSIDTWTLRLPQNVPGNGLGEQVGDQFTVGFRIFVQDPSNVLSSSTWTAVGPASENSGANSSRIGGLAIDPSDPSGNTVFAAGASGGVWKTTNFMRNDGQPTWVPLTDFGPGFAINIGSMAVFGRNNDPNQTIVFVATGEGDVFSPGVGFLRSLDGGKTWQVIDSAVNFDGLGNALPMSSPLRNHQFVGSTAFKVVIDPVFSPQGTGELLVYAALTGTNGGIWRSFDTGRTWQLLRAGNATDVVLTAANQAYGLNSNVLYAAFRGQGVFKTLSATSATPTFTLMAGGAGVPSRLDIDPLPDVQIPVAPPSDTPNGAKGRIVLAAPALSNNPFADAFYQGWLYAFVATPAGNTDGIYLTKDFGDNWTKIRTPFFPPPPPLPARPSSVFPTNNENRIDWDVLGRPQFQQGNYDISITVDPNNPNIIYLGGTRNGAPPQVGAMIRVDVTTLGDPYAVVGYDNSDPDGGTVQFASTNDVDVKNGGNAYGIFDPFFPFDPPSAEYFNMFRHPLNPFFSTSTQQFTNVASFTNDGRDVKWQPFHALLQGTNDVHEVVAYRDPLTGQTRLIVGDDHGVFTGVDAGEGNIQGNIGTAVVPFGTRNGNLQLVQFYYGAAQPSTLAAQIAGALFYGMAQDNGAPQSTPDILTTGELNWTGPRGDGTGVATDQTGSGTVYQYRWPCCVNTFPFLPSDFFLVKEGGQSNFASRTFGLIQAGDDPAQGIGQWPFTGGSNFAVNPIDGSAIVISSQAGRIFRTEGPILGTGIQWFVIGNPGDLDGSYAPAMAFGAPEANSNVLSDFIYAGTSAGNVFVTFTGGGFNGNTAWKNISAGLDGSPLQTIVANPRRGSKDAFAVTRNAVYYMPDSSAASPSWIRLSDTAGKGSIFNLTRPIWLNTNDQFSVVKYLTSLAVDWRFAIPNGAGDPPGTHPVLYVGGEAGVYRSYDFGATWTNYPQVADGSPVEGGYLPHAHVTDLDLSLGNINPLTGFPDTSGGLNMLVATTYGRSTFAIRMDNSPFDEHIVVPNSGPRVSSLANVTANFGSQLQGIDIRFVAQVDPVTFSLADVSVTGPNGPLALSSVFNISSPNSPSIFRVVFATPQTTTGNYTVRLGLNFTDFSGNRPNQNNNLVNGEDPQDRFTGATFFTPNTPPTISDIPNQNTPAGTPITVSFTIGDAQSPASALQLFADSSNASLVPNTPAALTFGGSGANRTLKITPIAGLTGTTTITVTVTDPEGLSAQDSFILTVNTKPTITNVPDLTVSHTATVSHSPFTANDTDPGHLITLTNQVFDFAELRAFELDQLLGLFFTGNYSQNFAGRNEKWVRAANDANNWYIIEQDGKFSKWNGGSSFTLVETLTKAYWEMPPLLHDAAAAGAPSALAGWTITPNVPMATTPPINGPLVVDPPNNFVGKARVILSVSDGIDTVIDTFNVTVTNNAPTFNALGNVTISHTQDSVGVPIANINDLDADAVTLSATVYAHTPAALAWALDQQLGLFFTGNYFQGSSGFNEKWMRAANDNNNWYTIRPNGDFHKWNGGSSFTLIATLDGSFWTTPTLLHEATQPAQAPMENPPSFAPNPVTVFPGSSTLTLDPVDTFGGELLVMVGATDNLTPSSRFFKLTVTNAVPTFDSLGDVTISHTQETLDVGINNIDDDDNETVDLSASVYNYTAAALAWALDQQLGLFSTGDFQNSAGFNEKWMRAAKDNNNWYTIRPNGDFHRWNGGASFTFVATLATSFWETPSLLHEATEPGQAPQENPPIFSVDPVNPPYPKASTLTLDPVDAFAGQLLVLVGAGDSVTTTYRFFKLTVTNPAPTLNPIANQSMQHTQNTLDVFLTGIDDSDGDSINLSAKYYAGTPEAIAYRLDTDFAFPFTTNFFQNSSGMNEKWLRSSLPAPDNFWYIIKPDGTFLRWNGGTSFTLIDTLDNSFWVTPSKIFDAPEPADASAAFPTTFNPNNNSHLGQSTMTIDPDANQAGVFLVRVAASDGATPTYRFFKLTINNTLPTMGAIGDQSVNHTGSTMVNVGGIGDADGDTVSLSAVAYQFTLGALAYKLDYELGLFHTGSDLFNAFGMNEKWMRAANDGNAWYIIKPDGSFLEWDGSGSSASDFVFRAQFANSFWADPSTLYNAETPTTFALDALFFNPASVQGLDQLSTLTLDPPNTFVGDLLIEARANDGTTNGLTKRFFKLTSTNNPPILPSINNQTITAPLTQHDVELNGMDPDNDTLVYTVTTASGDGSAADAFALDQQFQFFEVANNPRWFFNFYGGQEKWFRSALDQQWYAIFPNGTIRQFLASNPLGGPVIGTLTSAYWNDPTLLVNAQAPANPPVTTTLLDNAGTSNPNDRILRLTITDANFFGTFRVRVSVTDGFDTVVREFLVTRS
ncbi:MAG: proprotein convertase P-domain-containing protein [Gemmataceae bacterium]|nr:proprotein convertase P-domain-containing protein [Gemmataceae bacterium]